MEQLTNARLATIKSIQNSSIRVEDILRVDLEAHKRGVLILSVTGKLVLISWINKKLEHKEKVLEDISDALWQHGDENEVFIVCHSGAFLRYNLLNDTGITCSLQLSAPSVLSLIKEKDNTIHSIKSQKLWGHTEKLIVMQPQSDRLVLFSTNSGDRPALLGVLRTPPLRSAHIVDSKVIVQPITGSDLYVYSSTQCKPLEVISLVYPHREMAYTEWGSLSCSENGTFAALTDSERHLYLALMECKESFGKRSGIPRSRVVLQQVLWPSSIKPITLLHLSLTCSEDMLSLFCTKTFHNSEKSFYLTCKWRSEGSLSLIYEFSKPACLIPSISNDSLDLFLTQDGVCMLVDQDNSLCQREREPDLDKLLTELETAFQFLDLSKIAQCKSNIEQDLTVFLSSCNYRQNWKDLADLRGRQHAQLADIILSNLTKLSANTDQRPTFVALREMFTHHFKSLQEDITNVIKYVDGDEITQLLLQMAEQIGFYSDSVDSLSLPEGPEENQSIMDNFQLWQDMPIEDAILYAIENGVLQAAEVYLKMKPWIYGTVDTDSIISLCIQVSLKHPSKNVLEKLDRSYSSILKRKLFCSQIAEEIEVLTDVLKQWDVLTEQDCLASHLMMSVIDVSPSLIHSFPQFWNQLVAYGEQGNLSMDVLSIGNVTKWSRISILMVLADLYTRTHVGNLIDSLTSEALWVYLLLSNNEVTIKKWIRKYFPVSEPTLTSVWPDIVASSSNTEDTKEDKPQKDDLNLSTPFYPPIQGNDTESIASFQSNWTEHAHHDAVFPYMDTTWDEALFEAIDQDMIDAIEKSRPMFMEYALVFFSHFGLYVTDEKHQLEKILRRKTLLPPCFKDVDTTCNVEGKLSDKYMHDMVLRKMAAQNLYLPFFEYVEHHSLDVSDVELHLPDRNWYNLVNPFMKITREQTKETLFQLSIKSFDYLLLRNESKMDDIYLPVFVTMLLAPNANLAHFLQHEPIADDNIQKDVDEVQRIMNGFDLTPSSLIDGLSQTHSFLQPLSKNPYQEQELELTMYDLLYGNVPFDMSSLFTWQPNNRFGYSKDAKLYNFSDTKNMLDNRQSPKIDYVYYLRNGRPSFALASALREIHTGRTIAKLDDVKGSVYGIALTSWPNMQACASCIFFLLFTKQKCEPLRNLLYAANTILDMKSQTLEDISDQELVKQQKNAWTDEIKDLLHLVCNVRSRNRGVTEIVKQLEISTIQAVTGFRYCEEELSKTRHFEIFQTLSPELEESKFTESIIQVILKNLKICQFLSTEYKVETPLLILKTVARSDCWVLFLGLSDILQLPKEAVLEASLMFSSVPLKEHMDLALKRLYGLERQTSSDLMDTENSLIMVSADGNKSSFQSKDESDFIDTVIECLNTDDPGTSLLEAAHYWKVSAYAVLSACLQNSNVDHCFFTWLLAEVPNQFLFELKEILDLTLDDVSPVIQSDFFSDAFKNLISLCVQNGFIDILEMGIYVFYDPHFLINLLQAFQKVKQGSMKPEIVETLKNIPEISTSVDLLDNLVLKIVAKGIDEYLHNNHLKRTFLDALCCVPEFPGLESVNWNFISLSMEHLQFSAEKVNVESLIQRYRNTSLEDGSMKLVEHYTNMKQFDEAFRISKQYKLPHSSIILAKLSTFLHENSKSFNEDISGLLSFLESANNQIIENEIDSNIASSFFIELSSRSDSNQSKFHCLRYAMVWISSTHPDHESIDYDMWLAGIEAKIEDTDYQVPVDAPGVSHKFSWESNARIFDQYDLEYINRVCSRIRSNGISKNHDPGLLEQASALVDRCLQENRLVTACRLAQHFQLEHEDLSLILSIVSKANEIVPQVDPNSDLSSFVVITKRGDSSVASSYASKESNAYSFTSKTSSVPVIPESGILTNLKTQCSDVILGKGIVQNVFLIAHVSEACAMSFLSVIRELSTKEVLYEILSLGVQQISLARNFISAANIPSEEVTQMLVNEIVSSLDSDDISPTFFLDSSNFDERFEKFLAIVKDPVLCGNLLLARVKEISNISSVKSYQNSIELVILAHKCFSKSANIEGIGMVLQISQTLVKKLESKSLWSLMARLLTGVRRYSELHYIIDTLKKNGEFEHLLKKISDASFKTSGLDRELIHYLKSKYPEDKESLKMVVQHFSMHSDVAMNWMEEARSIIQSVISNQPPPLAVSLKKIQKSKSQKEKNSISAERLGLLADDSTSLGILWNADVSRLHEAVKCYSYASECYSFIDEFSNAMKCVHQAEIVALQIALIKESKELKSALRIINLDSSQLNDVQLKYLNVQEIAVFCDAYSIPPSWASCIHHHYIVKDRQQFFDEFCFLHRLTSTIVLELANKMESVSTNAGQLRRLGQVLKRVSDPELVYRVASQFKLLLTLEECLEKPSAAYLKDNVFKHGLSQP